MQKKGHLDLENNVLSTSSSKIEKHLRIIKLSNAGKPIPANGWETSDPQMSGKMSGKYRDA